MGLEKYFSPEARIASWTLVEITLAKIQGEVGMIPKSAAADIIQGASELVYTPEQQITGEKELGQPLIPYLRALGEACGESGSYVHYGATTQNIFHTGTILCLKEAVKDSDLLQSRLLEYIAEMALSHKKTVMAGRTHTQHALPITFGYKLSTFLDEFSRHLIRQKNCRERLFTLMMGGGVGSFASFGAYGRSVQDLMARELELQSMPLPSRAIYDSQVDFVMQTALAAGTLGRLAGNLRTLMRSETGELFQDDGSIGSSTMPQKRNPTKCAYVLYNVEKLNSVVDRAQRCMLTEEEASTEQDKLLLEAMIESLQYYYSIMELCLDIFETLKVNVAKMYENLSLDGSWIMAESLMFVLSEKIGKMQAHDILHDLAMTSKENGLTLREACKQSTEMSVLNDKQIDSALNPENYLGLCIEITEQTVQNIRQINIVR